MPPWGEDSWGEPKAKELTGLAWEGDDDGPEI